MVITSAIATKFLLHFLYEHLVSCSSNNRGGKIPLSQLCVPCCLSGFSDTPLILSHKTLHWNSKSLSLMITTSCRRGSIYLASSKLWVLKLPSLDVHPGCWLVKEEQVMLSSGFSLFFSRTFRWIFPPCLVADFHKTCPITICVTVGKTDNGGRQADYHKHKLYLLKKPTWNSPCF